LLDQQNRPETNEALKQLARLYGACDKPELAANRRNELAAHK